MKTVNEIIERLEESNIRIENYKEKNKLCGYELDTYTDCGVNQIIFLDFRDSELDPENAKDFLQVFKDTIEIINVDEEIELNRQDKTYSNDFSIKVSLKDFEDWKENLENIFPNSSKKTAQQRQFEQTVDKFKSSIDNLNSILELMPTKGGVPEDCQKMNILSTICLLDRCVNGIEIEDFTPNEHSENFKLSYS